MIILDIAEKPLQATLVLCGILVLFALEGSVLDIGATMLAPVFRLPKHMGISSGTRQIVYGGSGCAYRGFPVFRHYEWSSSRACTMSSELRDLENIRANGGNMEAVALEALFSSVAMPRKWLAEIVRRGGRVQRVHRVQSADAFIIV